MKKFALITLLLVIIATFTACGGSASVESIESPEENISEAVETTEDHGSADIYDENVSETPETAEAPADGEEPEPIETADESAEKPAEGDAVFEYDGKVFSFDEEKQFKRITYMASDSFTDHQYSNVLDYNGMLYAKKHRKQFQISIQYDDVVYDDQYVSSAEPVEINGTRWFHYTVDGRNEDSYYYYYPDAENECTYVISIHSFFDYQTKLDLAKLSDVFMSTVTLE